MDEKSLYVHILNMTALSWLKISTVDAVRKQLKISWNAVDGILTRVVKCGLSRIKTLDYLHSGVGSQI